MEQQKTILMMSELPAYCLRGSGVPAAEVDALLGNMSDEEFSNLEALLAEAMEAEIEAGRAEAVDAATRQRVVLHSILHGKNPKAKTLVAFSFSHALTEALPSLGGLIATVVATHHLGMANLPQAVNAVKNLWKSLAILRSPQDDDAIRAARGLGMLSLRAQDNYSKIDPSNAALQQETGLNGAALAAALKRLTGLNVIVNTAWGDQADDFSHPDNRWRLRV